MARYEHLPIFADAYRLALLVEQLVSEFSNRARQAPWFVEQQSAEYARCQPLQGRLDVTRQQLRVPSSQDAAVIGSLPLEPFTFMHAGDLVGSESLQLGCRGKFPAGEFL